MLSSTVVHYNLPQMTKSPRETGKIDPTLSLFFALGGNVTTVSAILLPTPSEDDDDNSDYDTAPPVRYRVLYGLLNFNRKSMLEIALTAPEEKPSNLMQKIRALTAKPNHTVTAELSLEADRKKVLAQAEQKQLPSALCAFTLTELVERIKLFPIDYTIIELTFSSSDLAKTHIPFTMAKVVQICNKQGEHYLLGQTLRDVYDIYRKNKKGPTHTQRFFNFVAQLGEDNKPSEIYGANSDDNDAKATSTTSPAQPTTRLSDLMHAPKTLPSASPPSSLPGFVLS